MGWPGSHLTARQPLRHRQTIRKR